MTKSTLTLLCLAGATSLAFGNLQPVSPPRGGKIPFRPGTQISRNHHIFQEDAPTDEDSYDVFYDQLADDGQWYYDDTYGYVFQPEVAVSTSDWHPYSDGHWDDTDRGWYWDSNERFGWATYHYGRWVLIDGEGWVWVPGHEWAPAWVSWRDSEDYCGWAPLPPECGSVSVGISVGGWCDSYWGIGPGCYSFIPWHAWNNDSYVGAFAPYSQNVAIINNTRNVTNIYNNNSVINNYGPQSQQVALKTNRQVTKYNINYMAQSDPRTFKTAKNGNQLSIVGPKPNLKPVATKPPNVAKTLTGTKVNKGWNNVNSTQANNLKNKFAQQNPVPGNLPKTTNALVKPTIIGTKAVGNNANNPPGTNKGGNSNIAANKGAGNGLLANQSNLNSTNPGQNKGTGANQLKSFNGAGNNPTGGNNAHQGAVPNNPNALKGAKGTGGGNNAGTINQGAQSNQLKSFNSTAGPSNSTKGAKGTGGSNNAAAGNKGTGPSQLKSFKSTNNTSGSKGAQGAGGGNYGSPKTLKKTTTGGSNSQPKAHSQAKTTYQPKPAYHASTNTYHPPANNHPSTYAYHAPASTYHAPASTYHAPASTYHAPANHPSTNAYHAPANTYHPPANNHPASAPHPPASAPHPSGGGGNKKDEKKK
jgi:hypothetical protein